MGDMVGIRLKLEFTSRISKVGEKLYITIPRTLRPLISNRYKIYRVVIEELE